LRSNKLSIREVSEGKDGYHWTTFLVQGWQENGKWQKRRFRNRSDAESFVALKGVEMMNRDSRLREVVTSLTCQQVKEAETAFNRLREIESNGAGDGRFSLVAAVEFFAKHHDPGALMSVPLADARRAFLEAKENEGVRARSLVQLNATLSQFSAAVEECSVCEVTTADIEDYLNGLRSKNRTQSAAAKTFNNYRADLHGVLWLVRGASVQGRFRSKVRWIVSNPSERSQKRELPNGMRLRS